MAAKSSTMWFWSDWLGDQEVRRLTPAERGVWIDMLALAAAALPYGYVCDAKGRPLTDAEIARVTGCSAEEVAKLIVGILDKGAASRDRTGRIYNRRMVRDAELKRKRADAGRDGGNATARKYFGKPDLPKQVPKQGWQTPSLPKDIKTLLPVAARETEPPKPKERPKEASEGERVKSISQMSRAEIEESWKKTRSQCG